MMRKYFLLAFVCFSLAQVQGNELENAIKSGLIKSEALYNRGIQRVDNVNEYQGHLIQTKAAVFTEKIQRMRKNTRQSLRRLAQNAEEKAKQMQKPDSVFECISKAENNANNQIQAFTASFLADLEGLQKMYSSKVQIATKFLETYRKELKSRYETTTAQIKACKNIKCVEATVSDYNIYVENVFEDVRKVETQIGTIVGNFQREVGISFNNVNRQVSRAQSDGIRQIKECVFRMKRF